MPVTEIAVPTRSPLLAGYAQLAKDMAELRRSYIESQAFLFAVICPISVGIALVAPELERVALGPRWEGTWPIIVVIALVALADNFSNAVFSIFAIYEKYREMSLTYLSVSLVRLALLLGGAWWFGMEGLLGGLAVSAVGAVLFWQRLVASLLGHSMRALLVAIWRSLAASMLMVAAVLALRFVLPRDDGLGDALWLLFLLSCTGAVVTVASQTLLWRLCGAPAGAERRLLNLGLGGLSRLRRPRTA